MTSTGTRNHSRLRTHTHIRTSPQVARPLFQQYLSLLRRSTADAAALSAAAAAGLAISGHLLHPLPDLVAQHAQHAAADAAPHSGGSALSATLSLDWGTAELLQLLQQVRSNLGRLSEALPELQPADRTAEVVENAVRQHLGLCFAALQCRLLVSVERMWALLAPEERWQGREQSQQQLLQPQQQGGRRGMPGGALGKGGRETI
jgi:hypothetical protein